MLFWFDRDQSGSGHSITLRESVAVTSAEIDGAEAYEVSGTLIWLLISYLEGNIGFYVLIDLGSF